MDRFQKKIQEELTKFSMQSCNLKKTKDGLLFEPTKRKRINYKFVRALIAILFIATIIILPFTQNPKKHLDNPIIHFHSYSFARIEFVEKIEEEYYQKYSQTKVPYVFYKTKIIELYIHDQVFVNEKRFYENDDFIVGIPKQLIELYGSTNQFLIRFQNGLDYFYDINDDEVSNDLYDMYIRYNHIYPKNYDNILIPINDDKVDYQVLYSNGYTSTLIDLLENGNKILKSKKYHFTNDMSVEDLEGYFDAIDKRIIEIRANKSDYIPDLPHGWGLIIFLLLIYLTIIILGFILKAFINVNRESSNKEYFD